MGQDSSEGPECDARVSSLLALYMALMSKKEGKKLELHSCLLLWHTDLKKEPEERAAMWPKPFPVKTLTHSLLKSEGTCLPPLSAASPPAVLQ